MIEYGVEFTADKVKISGPRVDGTIAVTFDVGEYEAGKVADLLKIPPNTLLKVSVEKGK